MLYSVALWLLSRGIMSHDTVWLCRQQLPIIYSWTIGFVQQVVILELSFKNLWWVILSNVFLTMILGCSLLLMLPGSFLLICYHALWYIGLFFLSSNCWNTNFSNWTSAAWVYRISRIWLEATFCSWKEMGPWSSGNFHLTLILLFSFPEFSRFITCNCLTVSSPSTRNNNWSA